MKISLFLTLSLSLLVACANPVTKAVNKVKYSAWESVGYEKRDLFKREVSNVKDEQEDTQEAFKDALEQLKEVYSFDGGNLEREQKKLSARYDDAASEAKDVHERIAKVDQVAGDLFAEWEDEIDEIKTSDLRRRSSQQLSATKTKYQILHRKLVRSEAKMEPVLARLHDQVLFLKHNLNAKAIAGLKVEGARIESDISRLMKDMEASNKEAEEFIKTL
ncbi:MAG: DUF2959 family protein [Bdellovibrionota bacterium]